LRRSKRADSHEQGDEARDDLVNAGATWLDQELVRDWNLTTGRRPQDMAAFVPGNARCLRQDLAGAGDNSTAS